MDQVAAGNSGSSRRKQPRLEPGGEGMKVERETNLVPPMLSRTRPHREPAAHCRAGISRIIVQRRNMENNSVVITGV